MPADGTFLVLFYVVGSYIPLSHVEDYWPGVDQSCLEEKFSEGAIKFGHLNPIQPRVCPVNVSTDPVNSNACVVRGLIEY